MDEYAATASSSGVMGVRRISTCEVGEGEGFREDGETDIKARDIVMCENGVQEKAYEADVKRYESEVRAFDRIKWVDLHILHSTVSGVA
jgi:hypothetical protein